MRRYRIAAIVAGLAVALGILTVLISREIDTSEVSDVVEDIPEVEQFEYDVNQEKKPVNYVLDIQTGVGTTAEVKEKESEETVGTETSVGNEISSVPSNQTASEAYGTDSTVEESPNAGTTYLPTGSTPQQTDEPNAVDEVPDQVQDYMIIIPQDSEVTFY